MTTDASAVIDMYRADATEALALYEAMGTRELLALQRAHALDAQVATKPGSIAFGAGRLALIAAVLKARGIPAATPAGARAALVALVNEQAQDAGLWFVAETAPEAYLQAALRKLHAAVERGDHGIDPRD